MNKYLLPTLVLGLPFVSFAAEASLQNFIKGTVNFINTPLIPFLFGIAFVFFVFYTIKYFVIGGANEKEQEKAKGFIIYSVAAFLFLIIFWGIINVLLDSIGLENTETSDCPDYLKGKPGGC